MSCIALCNVETFITANDCRIGRSRFVSFKMNYCWFALKLAQFFVSALIGILFLIPAGLVVNEDVLINENHGSNISETVLSPKHLICSVLNYDFAEATPEYLGTASYVTFPGIDPQNSNVSQFDHVRRALGCLQYYTDGDKSDCLCWGWDKPIIIFTVGVAAFTAGTSLCDMVSVWAAEGYDARTTWIQGLGSCICYGITGVIWIIVGTLIAYFGFAE